MICSQDYNMIDEVFITYCLNVMLKENRIRVTMNIRGKKLHGGRKIKLLVYTKLDNFKK